MGLESDLKTAQGYVPNSVTKTYDTAGFAPNIWFGDDAVNGDAIPWNQAPVGSIYVLKADETTQTYLYHKINANARDDDWVALGGFHVLQQHVDISDFTDGGSTTGTLVLDEGIPSGAYVFRSLLVNNTAAATVSTLTIQIGDGSDADRYTTGTPSVASAASVVDLGAPSGTAAHTAAKTVTITLTEDDDFTDVTAWSATVRIYYLL